MSDLTIGVDLGTTGTKVVLFDPDYGVTAEATHPASLLSPSSGFSEADPGQWITNAGAGIAQVLAATGAKASDVTALATTGMVPAVVTTDGRGRPTGPAIMQTDTRAAAETARLAENPDLGQVPLHTGSSITQQSVGPKLLWLRQRDPARWDRTVHVMGSYDWLLHALGADPHVEANWALESGLFTTELKPYVPMIEALDVDPELVPCVRRSAEVVGQLSPHGADVTGLSSGTALVVGGADHVFSAYSVGIDEPGDVLVKLGGAGDILTASRQPVIDDRLYLDCHPKPDLWMPNGCMATSGSLIRWFQEVTQSSSLADLDQAAADQPPASVLCLPYFLGEKSPWHDPELRGAFVGLHLGTGRAHMFRAVLEAIAFGFRHHLEIFAEVGLPTQRLTVTNGGSKSTLWKQIHADVLGHRLRTIESHPGAALAAAFVASLAGQSDPQWEQIGAYVNPGPTYYPDDDAIETYSERYELWRSLGTDLAPLSRRLAAAQSSLHRRDQPPSVDA